MLDECTNWILWSNLGIEIRPLKMLEMCPLPLCKRNMILKPIWFHESLGKCQLFNVYFIFSHFLNVWKLLPANIKIMQTTFIFFLSYADKADEKKKTWNSVILASFIAILQLPLYLKTVWIWLILGNILFKIFKLK